MAEQAAPRLSSPTYRKSLSADLPIFAANYAGLVPKLSASYRAVAG